MSDKLDILLAWIRDKNRKHPSLAFTAGQMRDIATEFEELQILLRRASGYMDDKVDDRCIKQNGIWKNAGPDAKPYAIFLRDGTKITVGRGKKSTGPVWLEIGKEAIVSLASVSDSIQARVERLKKMPDLAGLTDAQFESIARDGYVDVPVAPKPVEEFLHAENRNAHK